MGETRIDTWARLLASGAGPRRIVFQTIFASGASLALALLGGVSAESKKKKAKKKKKKRKKNKRKKETAGTGGCPSGLVPCVPGSATCCTPQSVIDACKAGVLESSCPGCFPGKSPFCDFCLPAAAFEFFVCCDLYAISGGPPVVFACMCQQCDCCTETSAIAEAMQRRAGE